MTSLPTLFISHGAPTFALEPGNLGPQLGELGRTLPRPRAVMILSAHWMTRGVAVQATPRPETVHDFGGFPRALYEIHYDAPGAPDIATEVVALLQRQGHAVQVEDQRGRDHGAWVPLLHLYPDADVPAFQLSLPSTPSPLELLELGRAVSSLREHGILVIGSGSLTHNLYEFRNGAVAPYVTAFAEWTWQHIASGDLGALLDYRSQAPQAARAHPTDEHWLPLYFAIGAAGESWRHAQRLDGGVSYGIISMDSFLFGCPTPAGTQLAGETAAHA